jgi:hypothetical protein
MVGWDGLDVYTWILLSYGYPALFFVCVIICKKTSGALRGLALLPWPPGTMIAFSELQKNCVWLLGAMLEG